MASGGNEHRMVFDIRGKRRHVVKVVYAILAILMGASLFLVVGPVNINSLLGGSSGSSSSAKIYEEQAERLERKLAKSPEDPELLLALTRTQLNAGNQLVNQTSAGAEVTPESLQQYQLASNTWSEYLKVTDEPSAGGAQLMVQPLVSLAESSGGGSQFEANIAAAVEAQEIIAKQRPSLNSLSTLALYTYFTFDYAAAEKARREALKYTHSKVEREGLENQLDEYSKRAKELQKQFAAVKAANKSAGTGKQVLENPLGGLGSSGLSGE